VPRSHAAPAGRIGDAREAAREEHRGGFRHHDDKVADLAAEEVHRRGLAAARTAGQDDAIVVRVSVA
jgi:hypothetical protein